MMRPRDAIRKSAKVRLPVWARVLPTGTGYFFRICLIALCLPILSAGAEHWRFYEYLAQALREEFSGQGATPDAGDQRSIDEALQELNPRILERQNEDPDAIRNFWLISMAERLDDAFNENSERYASLNNEELTQLLHRHFRREFNSETQRLLRERAAPACYWQHVVANVRHERVRQLGLEAFEDEELYAELLALGQQQQRIRSRSYSRYVNLMNALNELPHSMERVYVTSQLTDILPPYSRHHRHHHDPFFHDLRREFNRFRSDIAGADSGDVITELHDFYARISRRGAYPQLERLLTTPEASDAGLSRPHEMIRPVSELREYFRSPSLLAPSLYSAHEAAYREAVIAEVQAPQTDAAPVAAEEPETLPALSIPQVIAAVNDHQNLRAQRRTTQNLLRILESQERSVNFNLRSSRQSSEERERRMKRFFEATRSPRSLSSLELPYFSQHTLQQIEERLDHLIDLQNQSLRASFRGVIFSKATLDEIQETSGYAWLSVDYWDLVARILLHLDLENSSTAELFSAAQWIHEMRNRHQLRLREAMDELERVFSSRHTEPVLNIIDIWHGERWNEKRQTFSLTGLDFLLRREGFSGDPPRLVSVLFPVKNMEVPYPRFPPLSRAGRLYAEDELMHLLVGRRFFARNAHPNTGPIPPEPFEVFFDGRWRLSDLERLWFANWLTSLSEQNRLLFESHYYAGFLDDVNVDATDRLRVAATLTRNRANETFVQQVITTLRNQSSTSRSIPMIMAPGSNSQTNVNITHHQPERYSVLRWTPEPGHMELAPAFQFTRGQQEVMPSLETVFRQYNENDIRALALGFQRYRERRGIRAAGSISKASVDELRALRDSTRSRDSSLAVPATTAVRYRETLEIQRILESSLQRVVSALDTKLTREDSQIFIWIYEEISPGYPNSALLYIDAIN